MLYASGDADAPSARAPAPVVEVASVVHARMSGDAHAAESLELPGEGRVFFPPDQVALYSTLFELCDTQEQGLVSGAQAYLVLRHCALSDATLRHLWRLAGAMSKPRLDRAGFFCLLRLVALTQELGGSPPDSRSALLRVEHPHVRANLFGAPSTPVAEERSVGVDLLPAVPFAFLGPTLYRVSTESVSERFGRRRLETVRRYSEFDALRAHLQLLCPWTCIPVLPPKRLLNTSAEFLAQRRDGLQLFLRTLVEHPALRDRFEVEAFLVASRPRGWQAFTRLAAAVAVTAPVVLPVPPPPSSWPPRVVQAKAMEAALVKPSMHRHSMDVDETLLSMAAPEHAPLAADWPRRRCPAVFRADALLQAVLGYDAARQVEQLRHADALRNADDALRQRQVARQLAEVAEEFANEAAQIRQSWVDLKQALQAFF